MKQHQQALSQLVAASVAGPQPCPFAQGVRSAGDAADGAIDPEIDLDEPGREASVLVRTDRSHLAEEDHVCLIRHLVEDVFDRLWDGDRRGGDLGATE